MTLKSDFAELQAAYVRLAYHYTRFTEYNVKGESSKVRAALMDIKNIAHNMRGSASDHVKTMK